MDTPSHRVAHAINPLTILVRKCAKNGHNVVQSRTRNESAINSCDKMRQKGYNVAQSRTGNKPGKNSCDDKMRQKVDCEVSEPPASFPDFTYHSWQTS